MSTHESTAERTVDRETYQSYRDMRLHFGRLALAGDHTAHLVRRTATEEDYADEVWVTVDHKEVVQRKRLFRRRTYAAESVVQLLPIHNGIAQPDTQPLTYGMEPDGLLYQPAGFRDRWIHALGASVPGRAIMPQLEPELGYVMRRTGDEILGPITPSKSPVAV